MGGPRASVNASSSSELPDNLLDMQWGDVPAWVAVMLSALFGFVSWQASRRSKDAEVEAKKQASRATAAAENAARAQQETADASRRVAEAIERGITDAEEKPWRVEHRGGGESDWHLINTTTAPKYSVSVTGEPVRDDIQFRTIDGQESKWLDVDVYAQTEDRTITVRWLTTLETKKSGPFRRPLDPAKSQRLELP